MTRSAEPQGRKERSHTPENQSIASTGGKTSTPTMDGSIFPHEMDIDASAIHPEASLLVGWYILIFTLWHLMLKASATTAVDDSLIFFVIFCNLLVRK